MLHRSASRFVPFVFLALCLGACPARAESKAALRETFDVPYGEDSEQQKLDVFAPADAKKAPVILFVHGGTWMFGDKDFHGEYRGLGRFLARHGFVTVMTNYRLSPEVRHPEHARDVARAYAWTWRNIARYGGDRQRMILGGHSAGAHLAALVALDASYLADPALKLPPEARKDLRGVISVSGIYRVPGPDEFRGMLKHIVANLSGPNWMGPVLMSVGEVVNPFRLVFGNDRDVQKKASPLTHVHKGLPPFLVLYAAGEVPGLADQAEDFVQHLRKAGTTAELDRIDGVTHRTILLGISKPGDAAGAKVVDFANRVTAPARTSDARPAS